MADPALSERVAAALGRKVRSLEAIARGHGATVWRCGLVDGGTVALKTAPRFLACEGRLLRDLAGATPVPFPTVLFSDDTLLATEWFENDGTPLDRRGQEELAEALAMLHSLTAADFGYGYDGMIGGMAQINERQRDWRTMFLEKRLQSGAFLAHRAGRLPDEVLAMVERFVATRADLVPEPARPALVHGDLWAGNVLRRAGRPVALIDPAAYFGHPEMDLAFSELFGGFGPAFLARYAAVAGIEPGYEERRDVWNLWPLLVHAYLFGESYAAALARALSRYV